MASARLVPGEVTVTLLSGRELKDCDWFKKQDPYVMLICGNQQFRSNTHANGGVSPVWDQTFTFRVDQETEMELTVWDEDNFKDDCIGKGKVELISIRQQPGQVKETEVPLTRRMSRRQQGFVRIRLRFIPTPVPSALATTSTPLSTAVNTPDPVPRYEPTCGLIQPQQPQPDQPVTAHTSAAPPAPGVHVTAGPSAFSHYPGPPHFPHPTHMPEHTNSFSYPSQMYPPALQQSVSAGPQTLHNIYPGIITSASAPPPLPVGAPTAPQPYHQPLTAPQPYHQPPTAPQPYHQPPTALQPYHQPPTAPQPYHQPPTAPQPYHQPSTPSAPYNYPGYPPYQGSK